MKRVREMSALAYAADSWWDSLSPKEQKAYKNAHPASRYVVGPSKNNRSEDDIAGNPIGYHRDRQKYHANLAISHNQDAANAYDKGKHSLGDMHMKAADLHDAASRLHASAVAAHVNGDSLTAAKNHGPHARDASDAADKATQFLRARKI